MAGQRKALIIANDTYEQEALGDLQAPAADAEALGRVLGDPQIGDFAVQVVYNESAHVIQAQIEEVLSQSRPDDVPVSAVGRLPSPRSGVNEQARRLGGTVAVQGS